MHCRTRFGKGLGWDDYTLVTGAASFLLFISGYLDTLVYETAQIVNLSGPFLATKWVQIGLGIHIECLSLVGAYATVHWRSVLECLGQARAYATVPWSIASPAHHLTCLGLVETSLCLCVLRDISRVERRIATFLLINVALVGAVHISQLAMLLAERRGSTG